MGELVTATHIINTDIKRKLRLALRLGRFTSGKKGLVRVEMVAEWPPVPVLIISRREPPLTFAGNRKMIPQTSNL